MTTCFLNLASEEVILTPIDPSTTVEFNSPLDFFHTLTLPNFWHIFNNVNPRKIIKFKIRALETRSNKLKQLAIDHNNRNTVPVFFHHVYTVFLIPKNSITQPIFLSNVPNSILQKYDYFFLALINPLDTKNTSINVSLPEVELTTEYAKSSCISKLFDYEDVTKTKGNFIKLIGPKKFAFFPSTVTYPLTQSFKSMLRGWQFECMESFETDYDTKELSVLFIQRSSIEQINAIPKLTELKASNVTFYLIGPDWTQNEIYPMKVFYDSGLVTLSIEALNQLTKPKPNETCYSPLNELLEFITKSKMEAFSWKMCLHPKIFNHLFLNDFDYYFNLIMELEEQLVNFPQPLVSSSNSHGSTQYHDEILDDHSTLYLSLMMLKMQILGMF